jgi:DNA polymerase/3'-5' exonuclease PolX
MSATALVRSHGDHTSNVRVAEQLERVADLLEAQGANRFRVDAYRRAAATVRDLPTKVTVLVAEDGRAGLEALPGVGRALAGAILELVETGGLRLLDRLVGAASPEHLFTSLPGVGAELARRIHEQLGVETLEELETAAWDGRLEEVPGFGPRRAEVLRSVLEGRLSLSRRRRAQQRLAPRTAANRAWRRTGPPWRTCSRWMKSTGRRPRRGSFP